MNSASTRRIAPGGLVALKRALVAIYWYKRDLRAFLRNALDDATVLSRLDWDDYKRNIVGNLVDYLAAGQPRTRDELLRLMSESGASRTSAIFAGLKMPTKRSPRLRKLSRLCANGRRTTKLI
jgi:hypothetical protein